MNRFQFTRRALRLHVSEAAEITVVVQRRIKRKGHKARYRTVATYHLTAARARSLSRRHKALEAGQYRLPDGRLVYDAKK